jgi:hypothetical protein
MAELLIIGPLGNLAIYLTQWAWKKYHGKARDKENDRESRELVETVKALASFVSDKAITIQQYNAQFAVRSNSLGTYHFYF